jgi:hypothetical protein
MPEVMTPIIGWMAAAPFRSLFKMFPPLAVCGGAGWGKPTVIKTVMDAFGYGTLALGLNGTTPYGVYSAVSSTNAWPFWFEEYRPGCRQDAKDAVDQALRDAWEAGATARGGTTGTPSSALATPRTTAPIVITGEDTFSGTAHLQRILLVNMPKDGKNEPALTVVEASSCQLRDVFSAFLGWALEQRADLDASPFHTFDTLPNIHDRPAHGRACARWGYDLLRSFCETVGIEKVLSEYDESRILKSYEAAVHSDYLSELIDESVFATDQDGHAIAASGPGYRWVRAGAFCQWVGRTQPEKLPFGQKGFGDYLHEMYGANRVREASGRWVWRWSVTMSEPPSELVTITGLL